MVAGGGGVTLSTGGISAPILLSNRDLPGVRRVAGYLQNDITRVTSAPPPMAFDQAPAAGELVLVGTLGRSPLIDGLVAAASSTSPASPASGRRSCADRRQPVARRRPRARHRRQRQARHDLRHLRSVRADRRVALVLVGRRAGAQRRPRCTCSRGRARQGEPAVKYRGIFINDEAPGVCSGWARGDASAAFNHSFYEKVFELMLRLKGNYLWPAMWGQRLRRGRSAQRRSSPTRYGIVMGTSHQEPMMRAQRGVGRHARPYGDWNYAHERRRAARRSGARRHRARMGTFENIVTIGMRGDGDSPMPTATRVELMERIVDRPAADPRARSPGTTPPTIPQVWALYKEVQGYYDQGMRGARRRDAALRRRQLGQHPPAADPATAARAGRLRHLLPLRLRRRPAQLQVGRHQPDPEHLGADAPRLRVRRRPASGSSTSATSSRWSCRSQFFLDYAWNPDAWPAERIAEYTRAWAAQQFGAAQRRPRSPTSWRATRKFNGRRKPELLDADDLQPDNYREAETRRRRLQRSWSQTPRPSTHALPAETGTPSTSWCCIR